MTDEYYGKTVVITGRVVPIEPDEDLALFEKCCEQVYKLAKEIEENRPRA